MTDNSAHHGTFTLKRQFDSPPSRVFRAWSDKHELAQWAAPSDGWTFNNVKFEFRVGGGEISQFGPQGEPPFVVHNRFEDIVPDQRIVSAFSISKSGKCISSTVLSVEFRPSETGTLLILQESGVFLDGMETPEMRRAGTEHQLEQLEKHLHKLAA